MKTDREFFVGQTYPEGHGKRVRHISCRPIDEIDHVVLGMLISQTVARAQR